VTALAALPADRAEACGERKYPLVRAYTLAMLDTRARLLRSAVGFALVRANKRKDH